MYSPGFGTLGWQIISYNIHGVVYTEYLVHFYMHHICQYFLTYSMTDCAQYYTVRSMLRCFDTSSQEGREDMMTCMRRDCAERQSIERQLRQHVSGI